MSNSLTGRVAIVTGGGSGIGRASAEALLAQGAVVGILDRDLTDLPEGAHALKADVTDQGAVSAAIDGFCGTHGRLDVLVNNAGVSFVGGIEDGTEDDWRRVFDINVFGQMRVMRAALPWLRCSNAASVIVMSSCSALNGIPERALYSASKGAVQGLMLALSADLVGEGIRVNAIAPATVDTPFMGQIIARADHPAALRASLDARQPTGKMLDPAEIGHAVVYLASPAARSTTGTTIEVDGGMGTIRLRK
ncbi:SDR family NAD(P)-dependent oxidoreductase [Oceaniglobus trochenteri]|uniref:SDR family NAD(P)-dependent oxidoreductase n=1 Tax=Oceaniglobus trochenteri TaxID=2763260 RepID=UPI001CFF5F01|nr:SDR family oxidoreductase [Oceaniglobus trochenteri]